MAKNQDIFDNPKRLVVKGASILFGGLVVYFFGNKIIKEIEQRGTYNNAGDSPETQQALALHSAMNPSGISFLMSFDSTNIGGVLATAAQIQSLDQVSKAYFKLYNQTLLEDLQQELSVEDYQKFIAIVNANAFKSNPNAVTNYAKQNQLVVAKVEVSVRKSPDASFHGAFYENSKDNNIYWVAKAGTFIGYATGNQQFDSKNNVKFIQIAYLIKKENLSPTMQPYAGKAYTAWVSSSSTFVNIYNTAQEMLAHYPNLSADINNKKPLNYYQNALKGICKKVVVSVNKSTRIYNESLKPISYVNQNVILGEFLGELNLRNKTLIKFRNFDNKEYWADNQHIKIIESC